MKLRSTSLYFLSALVLALSACSTDDGKKAAATPNSGMTEFNDQKRNPDRSHQTPEQKTTSGNDDNQTPVASEKLFAQMKVLNIFETEMARWQGAGIETVVINGTATTADDSEIRQDFENGAPMCVIDFDSASSLANDFVLLIQGTDDTQELPQTNFALQDSAGDNFSIRCLHKLPMTLESLQQTFRGMIEFAATTQ